MDFVVCIGLARQERIPLREGVTFIRVRVAPPKGQWCVVRTVPIGGEHRPEAETERAEAKGPQGLTRALTEGANAHPREQKFAFQELAAVLRRENGMFE